MIYKNLIELIIQYLDNYSIYQISKINKNFQYLKEKAICRNCNIITNRNNGYYYIPHPDHTRLFNYKKLSTKIDLKLCIFYCHDCYIETLTNDIIPKKIKYKCDLCKCFNFDLPFHLTKGYICNKLGNYARYIKFNNNKDKLFKNNIKLKICGHCVIYISNNFLIKDTNYCCSVCSNNRISEKFYMCYDKNIIIEPYVSKKVFKILSKNNLKIGDFLCLNCEHKFNKIPHNLYKCSLCQTELNNDIILYNFNEIDKILPENINYVVSEQGLHLLLNLEKKYKLYVDKIKPSYLKINDYVCENCVLDLQKNKIIE